MPVETAADRALFVDPDEFGSVASWVVGSNTPVVVAGIFDAASLNLAIGDGLDLSDVGPQFLMRATDVPAGGRDGDVLTITIDGVATAYTVRTREPDGTGMVLLRLEKN
ncbi:hypothetical protein [Mesorhizobium sp. J428]|uniref:head-tail joining protein n=1 Tax=Mesorhizobium sp. J428 TaxID=2898440 RepID=UPI002151F1B9|nr:hypothetical protein [Mesorhizobium sp. J428]MCR5859722.1 hypothetical protein [Mesorhizobium sp. J428]